MASVQARSWQPVMSSPRNASIQDVARLARVSTATVSRVLNMPDVVAPSTAQRVRNAIHELGYRPNLFAKALMTSRSNVLGIALPDIHGEFYSEILKGADAEAHSRGYHLVVTSEARLNGERQLESLIQGFVDGVAVMITEPNEELWREAHSLSKPFVVIDTEMYDGAVDCIVMDNVPGTRAAVEHLLEQVPAEKCRYVGGPRENFDSAQRARVFERVLHEHGCTNSSRLTSYGHFSVEWGERWAARALKSNSLRGMGVLAGNDEIAYGIMRAALDAGLTIPDHLRIVGFDDTRLASLVRPRLSSVRVPLQKVGATAIACLAERIEHPGSEPHCVRLPTELVLRESS